ncbi:MAG: DoxX family membrane protein, partial [Paludibacteraceae bacterium]|nr:DoxX family membrane protein [Paludibacteraceae bacterium]
MTIKPTHIIGSTARTLLALTFLFSGFVKAVDPLGTVYKIEDYLKAFGGFFTDLLPLAGTAAVLLIATEWILGVCMLCNVRTKVTSWIALAFYLVMTPLTLWIALTNPVSDCGCFGDALVLTNWQTFWKNVVFLCLVIILLICKKAIPQLWSWWMEIVLVVLGAGSVAGIMGYSYTHLPPMDFRP